MNRSRVFYPSQRGVDDAGGAADLQTDVMRFMAILSLCLVAIFALVQSIPLVQSKMPPQPVVQATMPEEVIVEPKVEEAAPKPVKRIEPRPVPAPVAVAKPEPKPEPLSEPIPETIQTPVEPAPPEPPPPVAESQPEGFTLQFETDRALTQLVAANEVGLYAITGDSALRLSVDNDRAGFWQASLPRQYHEMDPSTVPDAIVRALRQSGRDSSGVKWGVTLPSGMTHSLNGYLAEHRGGALIIGIDGELRLEQT